MKQGVSVDRKTIGETTQVHLQSPSYDVSYSFITKDEFISQYLSEENLSYCVAEPDEDEEDDAEAFKLSLGIFREKLFHPDRGDLHEHDVAAAEKEESDQQRPVHDGRRIDEFRFSKDA